MMVLEARHLFRAHFPTVSEQAACLYLAPAIISVAKRMGVRLVLQAGSASWRRVSEVDDDGLMATHFSYLWEPHTLRTRMILAQGLMPELHVWAADPERQEIVDLTTGHIPLQCQQLGEMKWLCEPPPDFIWHSGPGIAQLDAHYEPTQLATELALELFRRHSR